MSYTKEEEDIVNKILEKETPHDILGVDENATESEIQSAFRKLALKVHPNKNKSPEAQKAFVVLNRAYVEVLRRIELHNKIEKFCENIDISMFSMRGEDLFGNKIAQTFSLFFGALTVIVELADWCLKPEKNENEKSMQRKGDSSSNKFKFITSYTVN